MNSANHCPGPVRAVVASWNSGRSNMACATNVPRIDMETGRVFMRELPFARDRWRIRLREQLDRVGPKKRRKPK